MLRVTVHDQSDVLAEVLATWQDPAGADLYRIPEEPFHWACECDLWPSDGVGCGCSGTCFGGCSCGGGGWGEEEGPELRKAGTLDAVDLGSGGDAFTASVPTGVQSGGSMEDPEEPVDPTDDRVAEEYTPSVDGARPPGQTDGATRPEEEDSGAEEGDGGCESFYWRTRLLEPGSDCTLPDDSQCEPPCVNEQPDGCVLDTLPVEEASQNFDWTWAVNDPQEPVDQDVIDLVTSAWAVLLDNLDIVEWVACLVYGEDSAVSGPLGAIANLFGVPVSLADCLVEKIVGQPARVELRLNDADSNAFQGKTGGGLSGGYIRVPAAGNLQQHYLRYLDPSFAWSSREDQQFCIVADLAATLLHELVHTCPAGGVLDEPGVENGKAEDEPGSCSAAYLIENAFRWAMGQRFPCLADTACWYYMCEQTWMYDEAAYPFLPPWEDSIYFGIGDCEETEPGTAIPPSGSGPNIPPPSLMEPIFIPESTWGLIIDGMLLSW